MSRCLTRKLVCRHDFDDLMFDDHSVDEQNKIKGVLPAHLGVENSDTKQDLTFALH